MLCKHLNLIISFELYYYYYWSPIQPDDNGKNSIFFQKYNRISTQLSNELHGPSLWMEENWYTKSMKTCIRTTNKLSFDSYIWSSLLSSSTTNDQCNGNHQRVNWCWSTQIQFVLGQPHSVLLHFICLGQIVVAFCLLLYWKSIPFCYAYFSSFFFGSVYAITNCFS